MSLPSTSRWLEPFFLGRLAVMFALVFTAGSAIMVFLFPSPTAAETISRLLMAGFGGILLAALGGLAIAIDHNTEVVREHVLPTLRDR